MFAYDILLARVRPVPVSVLSSFKLQALLSSVHVPTRGFYLRQTAANGAAAWSRDV